MSSVIDEAVTFADPAVQACPFALYDRIRDEQQVYPDPVTGNYVLTRYDDVRKALLNTKALSSRSSKSVRREDLNGVGRIYAEQGWLPMDTLVTNDPPSHRFYRTLVDKVFTTSRVKALEPRVAEIIDQLIDGMGTGAEVDFIEAFAIRLPMAVIAEQLGVAPEDGDKFKLWSDVSVEANNPLLTPEREGEIARHIIEMQHYMAREVERVRTAPDDRLISHLANVDVDGRRLDMRELQSIIQQLLVAGNETTTSALASGMKLLIEQPGLADRLHDDPALARPFVEETLRVAAPIQTMIRRVAEDVEIGGLAIPAGAFVEVRFGAANLDPRHFACPAEVDLARTNAQSHLAFGAGIHMCIGNQIARAELRLAFEALTRRLTAFRASRGRQSYTWETSNYIGYGLRSLWMTFAQR